MTENFGSYLKQLRLEHGFGLRAFSRAIGMNAANLSHIERGRINPPRNRETLEKIVAALGLAKNGEEWIKLFNLATADIPERIPPDITEYAREVEVIPMLLRTVANKKLTKEQIELLIDEINEHF